MYIKFCSFCCYAGPDSNTTDGRSAASQALSVGSRVAENQKVCMREHMDMRYRTYMCVGEGEGRGGRGRGGEDM